MPGRYRACRFIDPSTKALRTTAGSGGTMLKEQLIRSVTAWYESGSRGGGRTADQRGRPAAEARHAARIARRFIWLVSAASTLVQGRLDGEGTRCDRRG